MSLGSFTEKYRAQAEIFAFPNTGITKSVIVSDESVPADEHGKKIVPAGTIVGGINGEALLDSQIMVAQHGAATLRTSLQGSNNDLLFTDVGGAGATIAYVDPGAANTALSVGAAGTAVTVTLATNPAGDIITTADDIKNIINTTATTNVILKASNIAGEAGTGVVTAMAATALVGYANVAQPEGVLVNDVDVTHGPTSAAMVIEGWIEISSIPVQPTPAQRAAMPKIGFTANRH